MPANFPRSICILVDQLGGGGAERAAATLSLFFDQQGIKVQWVLMQPQVTYKHAGEVFVAGEQRASIGLWRRWHLLRNLRRFFVQHRFDVVIDFRVKLRPWAEYYLNHWVFPKPYVVTVHSAITELYFPKALGLQHFYPSPTRFVTLHPRLAAQLWQQQQLRAQVIPNPIQLDVLKEAAQTFTPEFGSYWLAVGRQDANKQYGALIAAFVASALHQQGAQLVLIGDGPEHIALQQQIARLGTTQVHLLGAQANPYPYMQHAQGLVVSSQREGLPMVMLEALALGCPVVAFDCPTGPRELIQDGHNGLLIQNQHWDALLAGMLRLHHDPVLRQHCQSQGPPSVASYALDKVGQQWMSFFKQLADAC